MTPRERRRALLEVGFAIGVLIGCIVAGFWLANLGPPEHHYDPPEPPIVAEDPTPQPVATRDHFTASTPRATVSPAAPAARPAPVSSDGAVDGAGTPPRATRAPRPPVASAPVDVPSAPVSVPSGTPSAPPRPQTPARPCVVSVLGLCVRL